MADSNRRHCDACGPRFRASHRAAVRLGLTASIAIAVTGCERDPKAIAEIERHMALREARQAFEDAYDRCLFKATGYFGSASVEVMRECGKLAASGMSAPGAETVQPTQGKARQPGPKGDAHPNPQS